MISAMAYMELCLRSITEPCLVRIFVRFLVVERAGDGNDNRSLLDTIIARIGSDSKVGYFFQNFLDFYKLKLFLQVCQVTLTLLNTLLELNCEDLMIDLVFK
jgi:hypothetical protein